MTRLSLRCCLVHSHSLGCYGAVGSLQEGDVLLLEAEEFPHAGFDFWPIQEHLPQVVVGVPFIAVEDCSDDGEEEFGLVGAVGLRGEEDDACALVVVEVVQDLLDLALDLVPAGGDAAAVLEQSYGVGVVGHDGLGVAELVALGLDGESVAAEFHADGLVAAHAAGGVREDAQLGQFFEGGLSQQSREELAHCQNYDCGGSKVFIMSGTHNQQELPLPRSQPRFRIHSAGKRGSEPLTCLARRKGSLEDKQQSHGRLNAEKPTSAGKVKLPREVLRHKMDKPEQVQYVQVRTEEDREDSSRKRSKTPRVLKFCKSNHKEEINDVKTKQPTEQSHKREGKAKYRCRVNQHIFDHTRRKSTLRQGEDPHAHFWQQVNESLILPVLPQAASTELATLAQLLALQK